MHRPLIIIADPDTDRSESIVATFNDSYACIRVGDAHQALAEAKARRPAVVEAVDELMRGHQHAVA